MFLKTKILFLETNSLGRPFAFVTPFSHPSFCALAIPVSFLCRSLYPHPNHAHLPQKLFSTSPSFFYYEFLLTPPPQTFPFHLPHFFCYEIKILFYVTNFFGRPFAFVTPLLPSVFFVLLLFPVPFFSRSLYPNSIHAYPFPQTLHFHHPHIFSTDKQLCHLKQNFCLFETISLGRAFAFVTPFFPSVFMCSCYPKCRFFCRSLYPNSIHVHPPPQPLFSPFFLSLLSPLWFLLPFAAPKIIHTHPTPQTLSFTSPFFY